MLPSKEAIWWWGDVNDHVHSLLHIISPEILHIIWLILQLVLWILTLWAVYYYYLNNVIFNSVPACQILSIFLERSFCSWELLLSQLSCFSWCCDCHYSDTFRTSFKHINAVLITDMVTLPVYKLHCTIQIILHGHLCLFIYPQHKISWPLVKFVALSFCTMLYTVLSKFIPCRFKNYQFHCFVMKTWSSDLGFGLTFSLLFFPSAFMEY